MFLCRVPKIIAFCILAIHVLPSAAEDITGEPSALSSKPQIEAATDCGAFSNWRERSDCLFNKARIYDRDGDHPKAIITYNESIKFDPTLPHPVGHRPPCNCIEHDAREGEFISLYDLNQKEILEHKDQKLTEFANAIDLDPQYAINWSKRAWYEAFLLKDFAPAIADSTRAIALDPDYPYLWSSRGEVYLAMKDFESALQDFTKAIELDHHSAQLYAFRGSIYEHLGRLDLALSDYTQEIDEGPPDSWHAWLDRANLYKKMDRLRESESDFCDARHALAEAGLTGSILVSHCLNESTP